MNYTGFGTDPNLIYSFRGGMATGPAMGSGQFADRFAGLRGSLAYAQADPRGRQRMEQAVEMGLPANTDISRVQRTGMVDMDRRPVFAAPRPQAWGTWEGDPKTGLLTSGGLEPSGYKKSSGPQPAQGTTPAPIVTEIKKTELGESGEPIAFTPFGERVRQESQPQPKAGSPFPAGTVGNVGRWFDQGAPRFPYAGY
jgi:hypothetical protein